MSDAFVPEEVGDNPDPAHVHAFEEFLDATLEPPREPEQLELDIEVKFDWLAMAADRLDQLGVRLATEHQPRLSALWRFAHCDACPQTWYQPPAWPCPVAQTILDHVGLPASQIKTPEAALGEFVKAWLGQYDREYQRPLAQGQVHEAHVWVEEYDPRGGSVTIKPED